MKTTANKISPQNFLFQDDETIPNNPTLPLLLYRRVYDPTREDLAELFERLFAENNWVNSWRNGVYSYHHYHSVTHEALAVYRGDAMLALGGPNGERLSVTPGDVIVIPAGVGHKRIEASNDFGVVGAYPKDSDYNLIRGKAKDWDKVKREIAATPLPDCDPLYGPLGPLKLSWKSGDA